jgi:putative ABC transport system permease protein
MCDAGRCRPIPLSNYYKKGDFLYQKHTFYLGLILGTDKHVNLQPMMANNLKLAYRHLLRQKLNTTLHIVGLTLGMSVCLLIALLIRYELSFDAYHAKSTQIYRINSVFIDAGKKNYHFSTPMPLADALRTGVSGLEAVTLAHPAYNTIVEVTPEKRYKQDHMLIVEPDFLNMFTVETVKGNAFEVLRKPYHALLTESTAKKFYGQEDPIGKTFLFRNEFTITVGGIIKDIPANSHLPASMLLSYVPNEGYLLNGVNAWTYVSGTETLVQVPEGYNLKDLEAHLQQIANKNINSDPNLPKVFRNEFDIQPLSTIHFDAKYAGGSEWVKAVNENWLWFFAAIGLAVLILACINFVNLSTAQALNRAKEVGVLKSIGAGRIHLMSQFLREAWILASIAGVLAIALTQMLLPYMNTLLDKHIVFNLLESPLLLGSLAIGIILTGFLAGLYPAWIIARFNPAVTLKARSGIVGNYGSPWLRKALVVTQFTISAGLLIAVTLIAQQVDFLRSKSLGFDRDNIINIEIKGASKAPVFASELRKISSIKDVAFATATPTNDGHWGTVMSRTDNNDPNRMPVTMIITDDNFSKMYGFKLLAGRFHHSGDTSFASETLPREKQIIKVVVNETLIRALGFESNEKALDQRFWMGMNSGNAEIIGVIADFNTNSLHEAIKPTMLVLDYRQLGQASIKVEAGSDIPQTLAAIETAWKKVYSDGVFQFKFLDDQIDAFYNAEARLYSLFRMFAGLAMLISCLGLWGLSTFAAQQRTKEVGIRKVLGASVNTIVLLLSRDFLVLVAIAIAIAVPASYYLMNGWLENFAFHIPITWKVFAMAGVASIIIALVTVSFQAIKAALANPSESLRTE